MRELPAEVPARRPGFLLPFGRRPSLLGSSCARWGIEPSSRSADRITHRFTGPHRGCRVAHEQDAIGQGALFTPGTVVRSRPATILWPAPAAFQRPVPTAPFELPTTGGHLHEASSRVHSRSPIVPSRSPPRTGSLPAPTDLLLACARRVDGRPWAFPRASHPAVTRDARRGGDGPYALARVLHLRHQAEPPAAPPT
jgi:hypothetical protein